MSKKSSFLAGIAKPAASVTGVFFTFPDTKMEVEIIPIDTVERRRIYSLCEIKSQIPGFRDQDSKVDIEKLDELLVEKGIGRIRNATVGCLKKIIIIDPEKLEASLREKLHLNIGEQINDDMLVPMNKDDALYLFSEVPKFKLWVDAQQGRMDVYNEAQKKEQLGN